MFSRSRSIWNVLCDYKVRSSGDLSRAFGRILLPVIAKTKLETIPGFKGLGHEGALSMTWSCYDPIANEACGSCNPCVSAIEEGLRCQLTLAALEG